MDVSLILTHRCNLDCGYCYAGEHHGEQMDDATLDRAVDLLFADASDPVQLSFFGGEPFLAFEAMQRATARAEQRAAQLGRRLILQCTTNGYGLREDHLRFIVDHAVHVTVSIDGVREAQELNRPRANGESSFERVRDNLRRLVGAGAAPDAMMVISPATARFAYRSTSFLWGKGVRTVRANMQLDGRWSVEDRELLREELLAVASELVARRLRGEAVSFEPFEKAMRAPTRGPRRPGASGSASESERPQVVVATRGNLYPCAPMVGPDRDDGPEAAIRIGHLDEGAARIVERARCEGTQCHKGGGCQCAAYLETGNRFTAGPNGRWYAELCAELGERVASALSGVGAGSSRRERPRARLGGPVLVGIAATVAAAAAIPMVYGLVTTDEIIERHTAGELAPVEAYTVEPATPREPCPAPPEMVEPSPDQTRIAGGISAPPMLPSPGVRGDLAAPPEAPPEVAVDGDMGSPPEPEIRVPGRLAVPP